MNRTLFALLALIAISLCACSDAPSGTATATTSPTAATTASVATMNTAELEKVIIDHEKKMWEMAKNKQEKEYKAFLAPNYIGVHEDGIKNREMDGAITIDLKEYSLSDMRVTFPNPSTAVLAYKATQAGTHKGVALPGTIYASAVWVKQDGGWMNLLYNH